jgi:hypothetical protein
VQSWSLDISWKAQRARPGTKASINITHIRSGRLQADRAASSMPLNLGARNTCCRSTVESVFDQRRTLQTDGDSMRIVYDSFYAILESVRCCSAASTTCAGAAAESVLEYFIKFDPQL